MHWDRLKWSDSDVWPTVGCARIRTFQGTSNKCRATHLKTRGSSFLKTKKKCWIWSKMWLKCGFRERNWFHREKSLRPLRGLSRGGNIFLLANRASEGSDTSEHQLVPNVGNAVEKNFVHECHSFPTVSGNDIEREKYFEENQLANCNLTLDAASLLKTVRLSTLYSAETTPSNTKKSRTQHFRRPMGASLTQPENPRRQLTFQRW